MVISLLDIIAICEKAIDVANFLIQVNGHAKIVIKELKLDERLVCSNDRAYILPIKFCTTRTPVMACQPNSAKILIPIAK